MSTTVTSSNDSRANKRIAAWMMWVLRDGRCAGRVFGAATFTMDHSAPCVPPPRVPGRPSAMIEGVAKLPAHRPSRRDEIVDAAIEVFAENGFIDTSMSDIPAAADVAVTAVYYHFAGKEALYGAAIASVLESVNQVVVAVRPDDAPAADDTLYKVIDAVWEWVDDNPGPARLMHLHTPAATRQAT